MKKILDGLFYGRNGVDELGLLTIWIYIIISVINLFTNSFIGDLSALVLIILILFRMFSKNVTARKKENNVLRKILNVITKPFENIKRNIKDKEHVYKKCPKCKTVLKLPLPSKRGIQKAKCPKCKKSLKLFTFKQEKVELITNKK